MIEQDSVIWSLLLPLQRNSSLQISAKQAWNAYLRTSHVGTLAWLCDLGYCPNVAIDIDSEPTHLQRLQRTAALPGPPCSSASIAARAIRVHHSYPKRNVPTPTHRCVLLSCQASRPRCCTPRTLVPYRPHWQALRSSWRG